MSTPTDADLELAAKLRQILPHGWDETDDDAVAEEIAALAEARRGAGWQPIAEIDSVPRGRTVVYRNETHVWLGPRRYFIVGTADVDAKWFFVLPALAAPRPRRG